MGLDDLIVLFFDLDGGLNVLLDLFTVLSLKVLDFSLMVIDHDLKLLFEPVV